MYTHVFIIIRNVFIRFLLSRKIVDFHYLEKLFIHIFNFLNYSIILEHYITNKMKMIGLAEDLINNLILVIKRGDMTGLLLPDLLLLTPPLVPGPALEDVCRDVLHTEGFEGLLGVLDDDSPGVWTVAVVVLDHLGQGLVGSHSVVLVRPGDQRLVLRVGTQLGDDGPEVIEDVGLGVGGSLLPDLDLSRPLAEILLSETEGELERRC